HGLMDKSGAPFVIEKGGSTATEFIYSSHRIYNGKPKLKTLPCAHADEAQTLELTLDDRFGDVRLLLSFTVIKNSDVLLRNSVVKNVGKAEVIVERAYSAELDLPESGYDFIHFYGDWCLERFVERAPLINGLTEISSNFGRSSHEHNPFGILCDKHTTENAGEAFAFSLVYSGNFTLSANVDKWRRTRVLMGINDEDFRVALAPKTEFEAPEGVLVYSDSGLNGISHAMHDFVRDNIITYKKAAFARPVLFNSWEGCYLDFDTRSILDYIDSAKKIGAELFVLDDGWFGKRDTDAAALGDWYVNTDKIDLKRVIEKCRSLGMKFGIWFEPEMINPDSELYKRHGEYALGKPDTDRTLSRHQLALDMTNDGAVDALFDMMSRILDEYQIDYIKWDHNRSIGEIYGAKAAYGETYHKIIVGTYKLLDRLQKKYPNIFFEGCASGGGRFDLGMLYYNPQIWTSDETDPVQRLFIQYGTSYGYPPSCMGAHISKNKMMSYTDKGRIALFGTYGMEMDPCTLNDSEIAEVNAVNEIYHKYHNEVIANGDFYRLCSPFEGNYAAMMSVAKDKTKAIVLFANLLKENNRYRFVKLSGLDENKLYKNSLDGKVYDGAYYMRVGLNLSVWLEEFRTYLVILEEC
ncbi:MAG: alpha-galactosidase, partial [Clostridiales bacterium]|nr:alpha-galactosidase [Clostridiales bacterium]